MLGKLIVSGLAAVLPVSTPVLTVPVPSVAAVAFDTCPPQVAPPTASTASVAVISTSVAFAAPECNGCTFRFRGNITVTAAGTLSVTIPGDATDGGGTIQSTIDPGVIVFDVGVKSDCETLMPFVVRFTPLAGGVAEEIKISALCGVCCPT